MVIKEKSKNSFTKGSDIILFGAILLPSIYNLLNRYFISYMELKDIALINKMGIVNILIECTLEFFMVSIVVIGARYYATSKQKFCEFIKSILIIALVTGIVVGGLLWIFRTPLFKTFNISIDSSNDLLYYKVILIDLVLNLLVISGISLFKSSRNGGVTLKIIGIKLISNLILDILLVSNYKVSFKVGIIGIGMASAFSNAITLGVIVFLLRDEFKGILNTAKFKIHPVKKIMSFGKWIFIESFVRNIVYLYAVIFFINSLSNIEVVSYNTINTLNWSLLLIVPNAIIEIYRINLASGFNLNFKKYILAAITIYIGTSFFVYLNLDYIFSFLNLDPDIVLTQKVFIIMSLNFILFIIINGYNNFFFASRNPKYVTISSLVINIMFLLPIGILSRSYGQTIPIETLMHILISINGIYLFILFFMKRRCAVNTKNNVKFD